MTQSLKPLAWDDFRLVKALADAGSMASAAATLGINHSTVFRRLAQIEEALGTPLFERHRSGYVLTVAGEEMVGLAQRLDADIMAFTRKMAAQEIKPAGELRITTSDSLLLYLLTPMFAKFQQACPDVRLDVVLANQALNLSKRDADVAIRATDSPPETLVGRRAARIAWALYGRMAEFAGAGPVGPAELAEQRWVSLGDHLASLKVVQAERRLLMPEQVVYKLNGVLGLAEAIEAGIGIGHLPCFVGDARSDLMRLDTPQPEFAVDLWLLTHPDLRQSARVRVFLDFMAAEIRAQRHLIEGSVVDRPAERQDSDEPPAKPVKT
jgi:DNA-binding transcriptional LysR family regulator